MCRLYAMHANEPTKVECGLVKAQNALMAQSQSDMQGYAHGHGWGVADYPDGVPMIEKQVWAAFHGEHFSRKAARVYAKNSRVPCAPCDLGRDQHREHPPFPSRQMDFRPQRHGPEFRRCPDENVGSYQPAAQNRNCRNHRQRAYFSLSNEPVFATP